MTTTAIDHRNTSLWHQLDEYLMLFEEYGAIEAPTAEQAAEYEHALTAMQERLVEKVDSVAGWMERQTADATILSERAAALKARADSRTSAVKRLKGHLVAYMQDRSLTRIGGQTDDNYTMRVQANGGEEALVVDDPHHLPDKFVCVDVTLRCLFSKAGDLEQEYRRLKAEGTIVSYTLFQGPHPNNPALRAALKAGEQIPGVRLVRGSHLRIS